MQYGWNKRQSAGNKLSAMTLKKDMDRLAYFTAVHDMMEACRENNGRLPYGYNNKIWEDLKKAGVLFPTKKNWNIIVA